MYLVPVSASSRETHATERSHCVASDADLAMSVCVQRCHSCVNPGRSLAFALPQCPHLQEGIIITPPPAPISQGRAQRRNQARPGHFHTCVAAFVLDHLARRQTWSDPVRQAGSPRPPPPGRGPARGAWRGGGGYLHTAGGGINPNCVAKQRLGQQGNG